MKDEPQYYMNWLNPMPSRPKREGYWSQLWHDDPFQFIGEIWMLGVMGGVLVTILAIAASALHG